MADNQQNSISWIALGLAGIALIFSVIAFNRSGTNLSTVVTEQTEDAVTAAQIVAARAEARADLIALRTRVAAGEAGEEIAQEVAETRTELAQAYENASEAAQMQWQEIDAQFEALEQQTRESSASALDTIEGLISDLERDVRTDEQ